MGKLGESPVFTPWLEERFDGSPPPEVALVPGAPKAPFTG